QVMNARRACPRGGNACKPTNPAEGVFHRAGGDPSISRGQEHVIVRYSQTAARFEILVRAFTTVGCRGIRRLLPNLVQRICRTPSGSMSGSGGRALSKCGALSRQSGRARSYKLAAERGTTCEAD